VWLQTADVLRLQKNTVAKTNMCVIAILSQCGCKTGKGGIAKKNTPCQIKKEGAQKEFQFTNSNKTKRT
jgi:hypothetical protein